MYAQLFLAVLATIQLSRSLRASSHRRRTCHVPRRGAYNARFIGDHYRALDTFRAKGYTVRDRVAPIGHSPTSWQHYIPKMLIGFFPPSQSPSLPLTG